MKKYSYYAVLDEHKRYIYKSNNDVLYEVIKNYFEGCVVIDEVSTLSDEELTFFGTLSEECELLFIRNEETGQKEIIHCDCVDSW